MFLTEILIHSSIMVPLSCWMTWLLQSSGCSAWTTRCRCWSRPSWRSVCSECPTGPLHSHTQLGFQLFNYYLHKNYCITFLSGTFNERLPLSTGKKIKPAQNIDLGKWTLEEKHLSWATAILFSCLMLLYRGYTVHFLRAWCKTIVTTLFYITSYKTGSFAPSRRFGPFDGSHIALKDILCFLVVRQGILKIVYSIFGRDVAITLGNVMKTLP